MNEIKYNSTTYLGLFFIVGGFLLFVYSEMRLAELDRHVNGNLNKIEWQKRHGYKAYMTLLD